MNSTRLFPLAFLALAACGSSDIDPVEMPDPDPEPEPVIITGSLGDTSVTEAQAIIVLDGSGQATGTFLPSSQSATVGGDTYSALSARVNSGLAYTRLLENGQVAFVEASGTAPITTAIYTGQGTIFLTNADTGQGFDGTADTELTIRLNSSSSGTLRFDNFSGQVIDPSGAENWNSGSIIIYDVRASADGIISSGDVNAFGFGDVDLDDSAVSEVTAEFAGPNFAEVAGTIDVSGTTSGSSLVGSFAGSR